MKTTIEISKYPLNEDYEPPIIDFIARLSLHDDIKLKTPLGICVRSLVQK